MRSLTRIADELSGGKFGSTRDLVNLWRDDKYLLFLHEITCKSTKGMFDGYRVHGAIIDGLSPHLEAPLQLVFFSSQSQSLKLIFASCTNDLIAYKLNGNDEWQHANPSARLYSIAADLYEYHYGDNFYLGDVQLVSGLVTNPGHNLLNDALPAIHFSKRIPRANVYVGHNDYYGLRRYFPLINANNISTMTAGNRLVKVYRNSFRTFSSSASLIEEGIADLLKGIDPPPLGAFSLKVNKRVQSNIDLSNSKQHVTIYLGMRSDKKRKLLADPYGELSWIINYVTVNLKRLLGDCVRVLVLIDTYSLPCKSSEFNTSKKSIDREKAFSMNLERGLSNMLANNCEVINISGMSFLQKMVLFQAYRCSFMGYLGAAYSIYSFWSGSLAPAYLIGHEEMLDTYLNPSTTYTLTRSVSPWRHWNPVYTTHGSIIEENYEPVPFEFMSLDQSKAKIQLKKYAYALASWILN